MFFLFEFKLRNVNLKANKCPCYMTFGEIDTQLIEHFSMVK